MARTNINPLVLSGWTRIRLGFLGESPRPNFVVFCFLWIVGETESVNGYLMSRIMVPHYGKNIFLPGKPCKNVVFSITWDPDP